MMVTSQSAVRAAPASGARLEVQCSASTRVAVAPLRAPPPLRSLLAPAPLLRLRAPGAALLRATGGASRRVACAGRARPLRAAAQSTAAATPAEPVAAEELGYVMGTALTQALAAVIALALTGAVSHPVGRPLACLAFGAAVGAAGLRSGSLAPDGAAAATLVGAVTLACGFPFAALLLVFYITSSKLTAFGAARKAAIEGDYKPGGQRSAAQVFANAGLPTILALAHAAVGGGPDAGPLAAAVLGYYACCCGDTWASELGVLSTEKPVLITTRQVVAPGTNGGVTRLGLTASAAGGALLGAVFSACATLGGGAGGAPPPALGAALAMGIAAGLGGSLLDSLLGATVQYSGLDAATGKVYNRPVKGKELKQLAGHDWISNSAVNLISAALAALGVFLVEAAKTGVL